MIFPNIPCHIEMGTSKFRYASKAWNYRWKARWTILGKEHCTQENTAELTLDFMTVKTYYESPWTFLSKCYLST